MAALTNAGEVAALNAILSGTVYISLHTADPGETGSYTNELSGGAYTRVSATFTATTDDGNRTVYDNDADISFPQATTAWAEISHVGIGTATTGGTMYVKMLLTESDGTTPLTATLSIGDTFTIPAGSLQVKLD